MHCSKSERRGLVDLDLGGVAWSSSKGRTDRGRARESAPHQEGSAANVSLFEKFTTEGNEKADEPAKEAGMLDRGDVAQVKAITIQQQREEVYAALRCAARFHCLVVPRSGGRLEGLCRASTQAKRKVVLREQGGGKEASNAAVCDSEQVSVYEMRKEQQIHENTMNM